MKRNGLGKPCNIPCSMNGQQLFYDRNHRSGIDFSWIDHLLLQLPFTNIEYSNGNCVYVRLGFRNGHLRAKRRRWRVTWNS